MASKREQILEALHTALRAEFSEANTRPRTEIERNGVLPVDVPEQGLVILRDGDPGEPEVTLSPLTYHYEHQATVEVFVRGSMSLDGLFDDLCRRVGAVLAADRTLGGLTDWIEGSAPAVEVLDVPGATTMKAATIEVMLHYATTDTLT